MEEEDSNTTEFNDVEFIKVSSLNSGIYFIEVFMNNYKSLKKVIIE